MARTGKSTPGMFGSYSNYDEKGKRTGKTVPGAFGGYVTYDSKGKKTGTSIPDAFGGYKHYDAKGRRTGTTKRGAFGDINHDNNTDACYIATCVYGSYDCPEVLVLRRYRDDVLKCTTYGRMFIRTYYAVSPHIVRIFGRFRWFHRICQSILNRIISRIKQ